MNTKLRKLAGPLTSVALFAGGIYLLMRALRELRLADLWHALHDIPLHWVIAAVGLTFISHTALSVYDYIGVRYIKRRIPYLSVALAAFTAYSISHTLGFPAVTGGTVRYRMYSRWGLSAVEVAEIMAMSGVCLFLGVFELGGMALLLDGHRVQEWIDLPSAWVNGLGVACLAVVAFYGIIGFIRREPIRIWRYTLDIPTPRFAAIQIAVSGVDWSFVAAVLYVLMPPNEVFTFPTFLGVFVVAYLMATLSNVPGGLGVFDGIIVASLHHSVPTETIVSSLLVYRGVYHLLPLSIGGTIFLITELRRTRAEAAGPAIRPAQPAAGRRG